MITGAARGLGLEFARAAVGRGDRVVATARNTVPLELAAGAPDRVEVAALDVTDREAVSDTVTRALERFGRLDIVINNAGYGIHGAVEELGEEELRAQLETNFFGAVWVMQAVLPIMRAQGSGHIINVSSTAGGAGFALVGGYSASKFAPEGITECLALEAAAFGVHVTIVEPSDFRTGFRDACHKAGPHDRRLRGGLRHRPRPPLDPPLRERSRRSPPRRRRPARTGRRPGPAASLPPGQPGLRRPQRTSPPTARGMGGPGVTGALGRRLRARRRGARAPRPLSGQAARSRRGLRRTSS
jgi:NAD(P)-dependent dehydrogenase (short-subunit alcohol dehydrogenase family)